MFDLLLCTVVLSDALKWTSPSFGQTVSVLLALRKGEFNTLSG